MPRTARASVGGICYHVINRGNARGKVFFDDADYQAFVDLFPRANYTLKMRLVAYCLMPNHFHLVLWPHHDGDLGRWMQWLLTTHVRSHHRRHQTSGHIWQGRYKAFPIQQDEHLLTVLQYVERNPVRAKLVERSEHWPWSCTHWWKRKSPPDWLHPGLVVRPHDWLRAVNRSLPEDELKRLRASVNRGTPWGSQTWTRRTSTRLALEHTLNPRGRPHK